MTTEQAYILALLIGAVILFLVEVIPTGVTGLLLVLALALGELAMPGRIAPDHAAFNGLVHGAVIAVGAMFVISAGITRTGAVGFITDILLPRVGDRPARQYLAFLLVVAVLSAFMNNTPLVLIFMPLFIGLADRWDKPPSQLLIPLSFVSILGGMCTRIGTSTNIVVAGSVEEFLDLGMFEFGKVGVVLAVAGFAFIYFFGRRFLPDRPTLGLASSGALATEYLTELVVGKKSRWVGRPVRDAFGERRDAAGKARILQIIRGDVIHPARKDDVIEAGDRLLIKGDPAAIVHLHERGDTGVIPTVNHELDADAPPARRVAMILVEVIVTPNSRFIDRRVRDVKLMERWGVSIFAVQRHGSHLREKVEEIRLKPGDILLVQGTPDAIRKMQVSESFLVVEGVQRSIPHTRRAPCALAALLLFIGLAVAFPGQVHLAALLAAVVMVSGRCLTAAEAYAALDWDVLFLLGGTLALGQAFERVGLAEAVASSVIDATGPYGERASLMGIFAVTVIMTQFLSNNAAAAIMTPLAWQAGLSFAASQGVEPSPERALPFVMAVAFGASCCFLTPVGYGTNLLVYGPGGYRFSDFFRIGFPLTLIFGVLVAILLPWVYG